MRTRIYICAAAVACVAAGSPARAQQQIEWKQTYNMPKGNSLPRDVKADILGIELGDSFREARRKLIALLAETDPNEAKKLSPDETMEQITARLNGIDKKPPLEDRRTVFRLPLPAPNRNTIEAAYVGHIIMGREMKGTSKRPIDDNVQVFFSSPASGQQVTAIERTILFPELSDHPLISETIANLQAKFKTEGRREGNRFVIQFNDGVGTKTKEPLPIVCSGQSGRGVDQAGIPSINRRGDCDIVLRVEFRPGMSPDHASSIQFALEDNDRAKANLTADYAFFDEYVRKIQNTKGAAPKL